VLEVDERAIWPQTRSELIARHHSATPFEQHLQNDERLFLKTHAPRPGPQLT
jgi:hypothetical protein